MTKRSAAQNSSTIPDDAKQSLDTVQWKKIVIADCAVESTVWEGVIRRYERNTPTSVSRTEFSAYSAASRASSLPMEQATTSTAWKSSRSMGHRSKVPPVDISEFPIAFSGPELIYCSQPRAHVAICIGRIKHPSISYAYSAFLEQKLYRSKDPLFLRQNLDESQIKGGRSKK
jgi:hypothetical protein